ncbi:protein rtoA-like [Littorina saxatilis]|uniref:Uncharacterized protein n=1 Tax=Littorina saxatilis TaxID=31220 RepID=A0AAN9GA47_9CAEN
MGGGGGSRPSSRSSVRSSSRHGSRIGSRRNSLVMSEDEEEAEVSGSQKAHLLVASQQRLVHNMQGLRHELNSLDEEVNRIRNDILNSRRFFNAMQGRPEQPRWGSSWRRYYYPGSGSSSPSVYSDNSYSDETESMDRSESCCSFNSWRSETELCGVFRETEDNSTSDKSSVKSNTPRKTHRHHTTYSNENGSNSSGGSNNGSKSGVSNTSSSSNNTSSSSNLSSSNNTSSPGGKDRFAFQGPDYTRSTGRYRQLGTPTLRG